MSKEVTHGDRSKTVKEVFDASIYSHAVLKRAAIAFAEFVNIEIRREGKYRRVTFSSDQSDELQEIVDEFANYALSCLMVAS